MTEYSTMKSYPEKSNLYCFTFSKNSEKHIKAVIRHLSPDTPTEDISSNLEDLGFNVINVRQMTTTRRATSGQTHMKPLSLFLVTLTRNVK
jgi:hypothetical protein